MNSRGISSRMGSQAKRILKAIFRAWWNPSSRSCASRTWSIRDMYADALDLPVSPGATTAGSPRLSLKRSVPWLVHRDGRSGVRRSEEHTSELQSLMRISYAVFCLKKKISNLHNKHNREHCAYN